MSGMRAPRNARPFGMRTQRSMASTLLVVALGAAGLSPIPIVLAPPAVAVAVADPVCPDGPVVQTIQVGGGTSDTTIYGTWASDTCSYTMNGSDTAELRTIATWAIPSDVKRVYATVKGAAGGGTLGGFGGVVVADINTTNMASFKAFLGSRGAVPNYGPSSGGQDDGGDGGDAVNPTGSTYTSVRGGGGGGGTTLEYSPRPTGSMQTALIAGGGGGQGSRIENSAGTTDGAYGGNGGDAGAGWGSPGGNVAGGLYGRGGGGQSSTGGSGGIVTNQMPTGFNGAAGTSAGGGQGGQGKSGAGAGGGGGGGYYGGGGGAGFDVSVVDESFQGAGGGGGSSWSNSSVLVPNTSVAYGSAGTRAAGSVTLAFEWKVPSAPSSAPTVLVDNATPGITVSNLVAVPPVIQPAITDYVVTCSSGSVTYSHTMQTGTTTHTFTIQNADRGRTYSCTYAYKNLAATGTSSAGASAIVSGPPTASTPTLTVAPSIATLASTSVSIAQTLTAPSVSWNYQTSNGATAGTSSTVWESSLDGSTGWTTITGTSNTSTFTPSASQLGTYVRFTASATNHYGSSPELTGTVSSAARKVVAKPSAPSVTATSAVGTPGQATVAVTLASVNFEPITALEYSKDNGSTWLTDGTWAPGTAASWTNGAAVSLTIPSLANGATYPVKVHAINNAGTSDPSSAVNVTPLAQIGAAPTVVRGDSSATITWTAPIGGGQTGYRVQVATSANGPYADAAGSDVGGCAPARTMATTALTCTATLTNETTYYVKVAATNANGTGAYSAASTGITPLSRTMTLSDLVAYIKTTMSATQSTLTLRPTFSAGQLTYAATVPANVGYLQLKPTVTYSGEEIRLGGNVIASGVTTSDIVLASGLTTTTGLLIYSRDRVVHADSQFSQTYSVAVTRRAPDFTPFTAYVTNPQSVAAPTPANYANAGVNDVTASNVGAIDTALIGRATTAVDSTAELQAIVDGYAHVLGYADNGTPTPVTADYSAIGLTQASSLSGTALTFMNSIVLAKTSSDVNTVTKLNTLADGVVAVLATAVMAPPAAGSTLTVAQLTAMGVTGVTRGNLPAVISAIATTQSTAAVDTVAELQTIVDTTIQAFVNNLKNYVGNPPAPTVQDYENAGVDDVNEDNLGAINAAIAGLPSGSKDSQAEIQAVVDAYNQILDRTLTGTSTTPITSASVYNTIGATVAGGLDAYGLSLLDSVLTVKTPAEVATPALIDALATVVAKVFASPNVMTIEDFETLGIVGVTADNLATLKALVQSTGSGAKDTLAELQALVDRSNALTVITKFANGLGPAPTIFDYLAAGVYRTTAANLAAVNAEVVSVAGAAQTPGSWTATTANVQSIVDGIMATSIAIISAYDGTNTEPVLATYSAAGVINVNADNLGAINSSIAVLPSGDADSRAEIQAVVDAYNAILAIGAGAPTAPSVSAATFTTLGVTGVTAANLKSMVSAIKVAGVEGVDTRAELQALVTDQAADAAAKLQSILDFATNGTPPPTVEDFADAGLPGVTEANLEAVLNAILEKTPAPSPWTQADLQGVIDSVTIIAVNQIADYPDSGGTPNPETYENAGIPGVTPEIVDELNIVIDRIPHGDKDTRGELEAIVEAFIIITSNAQGGENNGSPFAIPTAKDYETIGVKLGPLADDPQGMALLNSVIRGLPYETVSSVDDLNDIVNILIRLMRLVAGSDAVPPLTAGDFTKIGVRGVNSDNLAQMLANLRASGANGTFEPTLAFLQSLVPPPPGGGASASNSGDPLDPTDPKRSIVPGSVSALIDGQSIGVIVSPLSQDLGIALTGQGFAVEWVMLDAAGRPLRIDSGNVLVGQRGGSLRVSGQGYAAGSPIRVYALGSTYARALSKPLLLGEFVTDKAGAFSETVLLPMDLDLGANSLQINGTTPAGAVRSLTIGALLRAPQGQTVSRVIVHFLPGSAKLTPIAVGRLERAIAGVPADAEHLTMFVVGIQAGGKAALRPAARALAQSRAKSVARWLRAHVTNGVVASTATGVAPGVERVTTTMAYDTRG